MLSGHAVNEGIVSYAPAAAALGLVMRADGNICMGMV